MGYIIKILITAAIAYFSAWLAPGVQISSFWSAIIVAIVLGLLNSFVKPILEFISLPVTVLTMGLFMLVINAAIILLASFLIRSFAVSGFWAAMLYSIIFSVVSWIVEIIF